MKSEASGRSHHQQQAHHPDRMTVSAASRPQSPGTISHKVTSVLGPATSPASIMVSPFQSVASMSDGEHETDAPGSNGNPFESHTTDEEE